MQGRADLVFYIKNRAMVIGNPFPFGVNGLLTKTKYHSFEFECLAVVHALKRFHIDLAGHKFKNTEILDS